MSEEYMEPGNPLIEQGKSAIGRWLSNEDVKMLKLTVAAKIKEVQTLKEALEKVADQREAEIDFNCNVCGGKLVYIRGKHPGMDKRCVCPTCATERLEQIHEISDKNYGVTCQNKKATE